MKLKSADNQRAFRRSLRNLDLPLSGLGAVSCQIPAQRLFPHETANLNAHGHEPRDHQMGT
jgi:hypothetical protein